MTAAGQRSTRSRSRLRDQPVTRLLAAAVSLLAGLAVLVLTVELFPHHSGNHDEGVYLAQAELLLDGRLAYHAGEIADSVRPWFFVQDGGRLYPKYQPYPAALFAVPMGLFGAPQLALAATAAANTALVYVLGATAFDRRTGVVAAALFAASPLALLTSAVFLPYAPTTTLNLAFAVCYLRARRTGSVRTAAVAGGAIGLAFFARPYTAVLFAVPFVAHALWEVGTAVRYRGWRQSDRPWRQLPAAVRRHLATAAVGLAFVGLTLAYNARVTGDPLLFSYAAFAPLDGPGFGHRRILDHAIEYTPALALEANAWVLRHLATRWGPLGPIGTVLAAVGLVVAVRRWPWRRIGDRLPGRSGASDGGNESAVRAAPERGRLVPQVLLAGLFVSVPVGNLFFWGNYNALASFSNPADGLLGLLGPFYHFDLLAPLSIFAAAGAVWGWAALSPALPADRSRRRGAVLVVLLVSGLVAGGVTAALLSGPVERNAAYTDRYEAAYEPFEDRRFDDAVVFVPTPYGPWLGHPFQSFRNDPGLDGPVVYATDRHPAADFDVVDAYPDRTQYRYTYRGEWNSVPDEQIEPRLERLETRSSERLVGETVVGVPDRVSHASVRLEVDDEAATYRVDDPGETVAVPWSLSPDGARLDGAGGADADGAALSVDDTDEVALQVRLVEPGGSTLTYRQEATVRTTGDRVEVRWPPERTVCTLVDDCGREGTYLADRPSPYGDWVSFETRLEAGEG